MVEQTTPYGISIAVALPYARAVETTRTEIDIRATSKSKLDVDFRPYLILDAVAAMNA